MKQIYVLRSEDEKITKIGNTSNLSCRVDGINFSEKKTYYLVYNTEPLPKDKADELEKEIINNFSEDVVRGREWLGTHPLDVIKFIVSLVGKTKKKDIECLDTGAKYPYWVASNKDFNNCSYYQDNGVGIKGVDCTCHVRILYKGKKRTIVFCNLGDANRFARKYKHNIRVLDKITLLLYGVTNEVWKKREMHSKKSINEKWFLH